MTRPEAFSTLSHSTNDELYGRQEGSTRTDSVIRLFSAVLPDRSQKGRTNSVQGFCFRSSVVDSSRRPVLIRVPSNSTQSGVEDIRSCDFDDEAGMVAHGREA